MEHKTDPKVVEAYRRAYERAAKARLICYRLDESTFEVPSQTEPWRLHTVKHVGERWYQWSCDCKGRTHLSCVHRAVAVYAWKYKTGAVKPAARKGVRHTAEQAA